MKETQADTARLGMVVELLATGHGIDEIAKRTKMSRAQVRNAAEKGIERWSTGKWRRDVEAHRELTIQRLEALYGAMASEAIEKKSARHASVALQVLQAQGEWVGSAPAKRSEVAATLSVFTINERIKEIKAARVIDVTGDDEDSYAQAGDAIDGAMSELARAWWGEEATVDGIEEEGE